jgi:hypothetical protein
LDDCPWEGYRTDKADVFSYAMCLYLILCPIEQLDTGVRRGRSQVSIMSALHRGVRWVRDSRIPDFDWKVITAHQKSSGGSFRLLAEGGYPVECAPNRTEKSPGDSPRYESSQQLPLSSPCPRREEGGERVALDELAIFRISLFAP